MSKLRILIVDDNADFAESLGEALQLHGHEVALAFDGQEGVRRYREEDFDIAFMDVRMPGQNGVESFMQIRQLKPDARVVMMTGFSVEQLLEQAVQSGAWGVLHKPLDMDRVLDMLKQVSPAGILIADDDRDFVNGLREVLEEHGYRVLVAYNGREAVERVSAGGVDVLVLDLRMPILDGLGVYLELRRRGRVVPTIIATAFAAEEADALDRLAAYEVSGVLTKPFKTEALLRAISAVTRTPPE